MKRTTLRARLTAGIIISSASALLLGTTAVMPTFAAEQSTTSAPNQTIGAHTHQLHGTIISVDSSTSFSVATERFGKVTVVLGVATVRGHGQGHGRAASVQPTTTANLKAGDHVVVLGSTGTDGKFDARRVHVLPAADEGTSANVNHVVGTIASVQMSNGVVTGLTLTLADNSSQTVTVSTATRVRPHGDTAADLKSGMRVTVVAREGVATGIVVMPG